MGEATVAPEPGTGVDEQRQILARLEGADVEEKAIGDAEARRHVGARRLRRVRQEGAADAERHDAGRLRPHAGEGERSRRVASESAITRRASPASAAARRTLRHSAGVPSSGARRSVKSCTVSTTGVRRARGTAYAVAWNTSIAPRTAAQSTSRGSAATGAPITSG